MKVLFFGDSVTESGRDRANVDDIGHGYPMYASRVIAERFPKETFTFYNRGIGGNRTAHLVSRLDEDLVAVSPDVTVLMIGVNDAWAPFSVGDHVSEEDFRKNLITIASAAHDAGSALVILEPFLLPDEKHLPAFAELDEKIRIVREVAREHADAFVAIHAAFAEALVGHDCTEFSSDGVHPNDFGARFIAEKALAAIVPVIERVLATTEMKR